jgi:subtilase family serine protease
VSQADIDKITGWLGQQGFTVQSIARGRNGIAFSATAGQIQTAFGAEIHRYLVNGALHYGVATNPSIPAAFDGVVSAIHGLHDFLLKPRGRRSQQPRIYSAARNNWARAMWP